MAEYYDVLIKGGTVVNHDGIGQRDIGVIGGRIAAIGRLDAAAAAELVDASDLHVLPGVIDTQVHFREPGLEQKEDLETGSRAAVVGGVTAVFEMPNTKPLTTSPDTLSDKIERARHRMFCDFAFYVGGTRENVDDIPPWKSARLRRHQGLHGCLHRRPARRGRALARPHHCPHPPPRRVPLRGRGTPGERAGLRRHGDPPRTLSGATRSPP